MIEVRIHSNRYFITTYNINFGFAIKRSRKEEREEKGKILHVEERPFMTVSGEVQIDREKEHPTSWISICEKFFHSIDDAMD